jgi:hypothetical protein
MIINKPFHEQILNEKINYEHEVINYDILSEKIDEEYGFRLYTNIPEIKKSRNFFIYEERTIGYILNKLTSEYEAVVNVDKRKGIISLNPMYDFFIEMPQGWKMNETVDLLRDGFRNVSFRISGNRIYAYGSEKSIENIKYIMMAIEKDSNKVYNIMLNIYEYPDDKDDVIAVMKDPSSFKKAKKITSTVINYTHGQRYGFNFKGKYIGTEFNSIKKAIIINNKKIPISNIDDLGYVFKGNDDINYIIYLGQKNFI